jgi:hypothetical protein
MSELNYTNPIAHAVARAATEVDVGDDLFAAQGLLTAALDDGDDGKPLTRNELLLASIAAGVIAFARAVTNAMEDDDE